MRQVTAIVIVLVSISRNQPTRVAAQPAWRHDNVIARMATRNASIVIRAGVSEPTYCVESTGGQVLAKDATLGQLKLENAAAFQKVKSMQDGLLWAGLSTGD